MFASFLFVLLLLLITVGRALPAQADGMFDHGTIAYSKTAPTDPVARLQSTDTADFGHLSADDRAAISEILLETKPDFALAVRM